MRCNCLSAWVSVAGIYAFSSNDIKVGSNIEVDGAPWRVLGIMFVISFVWLLLAQQVSNNSSWSIFLLSFVEFLHVKPGKGAAFVRTKLRNYMTGTTVERTFRAGITVSLF